jgi:hypothetical protein
MNPAQRITTLVAAVGLVAGCAHQPYSRGESTAPTATCAPGDTAMRRSVLYFGAAIPDSSDTVDAAEWQAFLDRDVTPRFPDGLTWFDARGQWRGHDGQVIGEDSRVLILLHGDDAAATASIETIRNAYKQTFAQEAVMVERELSCVAF